MSSRTILVIGALSCLLLLPAAAADEAKSAAPELFAKGKTLLVEGNLSGALEVFTEAAKADPGNAEYTGQARLLRRVMALEKYVMTSEVSPKWEKMALSLHVYFLRNKVYSRALALDKIVHKKLHNAKSASMVAETLLDTGRNADAVSFLGGLDEKSVSPDTKVCLGIALARLGKKDEAAAACAGLALPDDAGPGELIDFARFYALTGERKAACDALASCLGKTPPRGQKLVCSFVKECGDFASLSGDAAFAAALKTPSKIKESSCSGGSSCSTCPNRSGCSSKGDSGEDCDSCKDKKEKGSEGK